jgi:phosphoserine aminotransferase
MLEQLRIKGDSIMGKRIFNFNAGPAALPLPVLQEMQSEFVDYKGSGMSILEMSHRSKWFDDVINEAVGRTRRLLGLGDDFEVLFLQGGGKPSVLHDSHESQSGRKAR